MSGEPLPALRRLGWSVVPGGGRPLLRLWDPLGVSPVNEGLLVEPSDWRLALALDGQRTAAEIAEELSVEGGAARVASVALRLADARMLEDETFEVAVAERMREFRERRSLPAHGAGSEYPRDPFELRMEVGGLVANDWDMPSVSSLRAVWTPSAPHRRAGALYARSWAAMRSAAPAARVLLLAATDCELSHPLVPLEHDLETPLGSVATDREAVAALSVLSGRDVLAHDTSRVLERQALFLRVILPDVPIVPVLVSALPQDPRDPEGAVDPAEREEVAQALEALQRLRELGGDTRVLCAANLQHVAGSGEVPTSDARFVLGGSAGRRLRDTDTAVVDAATRLDATELFAAAREGAGPRAASRLLAPYLLLRYLERNAPAETRGSTLGYLQIPGRHELATAVSVAFHTGPDEELASIPAADHLPA